MENLSNMSENQIEEYKKTILEIINRLQTENCIFINQEIENNEVCYNIGYTQPDWFLKLSDDVKYNVQMNFKDIYTPQIVDLLKNHINNSELVDNDISGNNNIIQYEIDNESRTLKRRRTE